MKEKYLHKGAPSADMHTLALSEPLAVSAEGIMAAAQAHGAPLQEQRILVIGGGIIGMGCLVVLKYYYNCEDVTVHDIEPARVARAVTFGALRLPADMQTSAGGQDYASLYGRDGFDVIIETTGARSAFEQALQLLNPGGTLAMTGYLGKTEFAPKDLVLKAARMVGRIGGTEMFGEIVPWLAEYGAMARKALVTHIFPAERAAEAFATARDRENVLKVQLTF
jgi:threonine dehydrogenase-like Zn-dependent dehydrogenase